MQNNFPQPPIDPPYFPECAWCDGQKTVEVGAIIDVMGKTHQIDPYTRQGALLVECRRCNGTGNEPEPDEYDNPNIP